MNNFKSFTGKLYQVNDQSFDDIALQLFRYQAQHNLVYNEFIRNLRVKVDSISRVIDIPFLPVTFFKRHAIQTGSWKPEVIFTSSSTTGSVPSQHLVNDLRFYLQHSKYCFEYHFGPVQNYHFLALLPSYMERQGSSLIEMIRYFIDESQSDSAGFYLRDYDSLLRQAQELQSTGGKVVIWGVTFALLELAERYQVDLSDCIIFETGGMKGRRKEITRTEFYSYLRERLKVTNIHSEYGMTELMSQAYSITDTRFKNPPSMKVLGRDLSDPMEKGIIGETVGLNVIDLANAHSISFIETEDLGKVYENGTFEVLGRIDNSDIRGCNLMV